MRIYPEMLTEGEHGIAVRGVNGKYHVVELTVSTGYHGTRRYSRKLGTDYKTESGARKSLNRWKNHFSYLNYKNIGTIDNTVFNGEINQ